MDEPIAICTVAVIVVTVIFSAMGFQNPAFRDRHLFWVEPILAGKEYRRLFTSAFLHADLNHLLMNMISLYFFGPGIEFFLGAPRFLVIYFAAILGGSLVSLWVHRHHDYRAYGASGGVCGIIFSHILLFPGGTISQFPLPVPIPTWLYAILFFVGSFFALKRRADNVGHDAHLGGAIIGLWTTAALEPWIVPGQLKLFLTISGLSLLLFVYLVKNPLFLPLSSFVPDWSPFRWKSGPPPPKHKRESVDLDAVLDKISKSGMDSLNAEERAVLNSAAEKYRRRADSKKPSSDLII